MSQRSWMAVGYRWLPAHRLSKVLLLQRIVDLVRVNGLLTLEGDLSKCRGDLQRFCGSVWYEPPSFFEESGEIGRHQRVSLLIDPSTVEQISRVILPRVGVVRNVVHVIISQHGVELIGAFDNFHRDCLVAGPDALPLLEWLANAELLRSYAPVKPDERFWHSLSSNGIFVNDAERAVTSQNRK